MNERRRALVYTLVECLCDVLLRVARLLQLLRAHHHAVGVCRRLTETWINVHIFGVCTSLLHRHAEKVHEIHRSTDKQAVTAVDVQRGSHFLESQHVQQMRVERTVPLYSLYGVWRRTGDSVHRMHVRQENSQTRCVLVGAETVEDRRLSIFYYCCP